VCRVWRHVILASPTYLNLHLVCTYGTPVKAMLDHSPPFPLVLYYPEKLGTPATMSYDDKLGAIFALQQRERVRRVHIAGSAASLRDLVGAMEHEYPRLQRLIVRLQQAEPENHNRNRRPNNVATVRLPENLRAPLMRRLILSNVALPAASSQLLSAAGTELASLGLIDFPALPPDFDPAHLITQLSALSYLESITIYFGVAVPSREILRMLQGLGAPTTGRTMLPRLRILAYRGSSAYLDKGILARFNAPNLRTLNIELFYQPTLSLPSLHQFARTVETLKFRSASLHFDKHLASLIVDPLDKHDRGPGDTHPLHVQVKVTALDSQVPSITHICSALAPLLAQTESLTLGFHKDGPMTVVEVGAAAGWQVGDTVVDRAQWRLLLRIFEGVKTLQVTGGGIGELFCALQPPHGEGNGNGNGSEDGTGEDGDVFAPVILPELQKLVPRGWGHTEDTFASFLAAREAAGHPVRLIRSRM
jgi:hypothetical protein